MLNDETMAHRYGWKVQLVLASANVLESLVRYAPRVVDISDLGGLGTVRPVDRRSQQYEARKRSKHTHSATGILGKFRNAIAGRGLESLGHLSLSFIIGFLGHHRHGEGEAEGPIFLDDVAAGLIE